MASISSTTSTSTQNAALRALVQALTTSDSNAITTLQTRRSTLQTELRTYQDLGTRLSSLRTQARALSSSSLGTMSARGMDTSILEVTAGSGARAGSHTVTVEQLASRHNLASRTVEAEDKPAISTGEGSVGNFRFRLATATDQMEVAVAVTAGSTYAEILSTIAQGINGAGTLATASVVDVGDGTLRLSIQAAADGAAAAITTIADLDGRWMSTLGLAGSGSAEHPLPATVQPGQDARLLVDGITAESSDNSFSSVIPGVVLTAKTAGESAQTFELSADTDAAVKKVQSFVSSFNSALSQIRGVTTAGDNTGAGRGALAGSAAFSQLRNSLTSAVLRPVDGDSRLSLGSLGISTNRDGSLVLGSEESLRAAVSGSPGEVKTLLGGVGDRVAKLVDAYSRVGGVLTQHQNSVQSQTRLLNDRISRSTAALDRKQNQLMSQLGQLEATLGSLSQQQQYLDSLLGVSSG